MNNKYLVINGGSSSLKFSVYNVNGDEYTELINGYVEKIGKEDSFYTLKFKNNKVEKKELIMTHTDAVKVMLSELINYNIVSDLSEIAGIGHRVLHGGEIYDDSVIIDDIVLADIISLTKLGPLHHPGEIAAIKSLKECLPNVDNVAVFDTAFHQTMPKENYMYAVPKNWYTENGVRKYGFHGTSHKYITKTMKDSLDKEDVNLIICHIGSGASISCIKNGISVDTSMGLTPLPGLIMGTRSGDIDSSILEYICKERNLTIGEVTDMLNKESGLLGICGQNDCRDLLKLVYEGNEDAKLALRMFEKSIAKYIAQYYVELDGKVDGIIFTAGIGENNPSIRKEIIDMLSNALDIHTNDSINDEIYKNGKLDDGIITTANSKIPVYVLKTDEEYMIVHDTVNVIKSAKLNKGTQKTLTNGNKR